MTRAYESCPQCSTRLVKIDDSAETFGDPPLPSIGWYVCPSCSEQVVLDREHNLISGGFAPRDFKRLVRDGKITAEGSLPRGPLIKGGTAPGKSTTAGS